MGLHEANLKFTLEYQNVEYEADVTVKYAVDHSYGADADGNRGGYAEFVEDMDINYLENIITGQPVTDIDEDLYNAIGEAADQQFHEG